MRAQAILGGSAIKAGMLTSETLEILETACNGSIKGTALPRCKRCIDFYQGGEEFRIEQGEYLVLFETPKGKIFQVWKKEDFRKVFIDVDPIPY